MGKVIKRWSAVMVGGALLALSASASAGNQSSAVKLTEAELDQITAGAGAISGVLIFNPGQGPGVQILNPNRTHSTCVNCMLAPNVARTSGVHGVLTPNGRYVTNPIRQEIVF